MIGPVGSKGTAYPDGVVTVCWGTLGWSLRLIIYWKRAIENAMTINKFIALLTN